MSVALFIIAVCISLVVVTGLPIGVWHIVYTLKRKHRLELQADSRANAKHLAEDFASITKELSDGMSMEFKDYISTPALKRRGKNGLEN